MYMFEGRWSTKVKVYRKGDTHRPVCELGVKPPIRTQTLCGEDPLGKSRTFDITRGCGGGTHQKGPVSIAVDYLDSTFCCSSQTEQNLHRKRHIDLTQGQVKGLKTMLLFCT